MNEKQKIRLKSKIETFFALAFVFVFASFAAAQTEKLQAVKTHKVFLIDFEKIGNEETKIVELKAAYDALWIEFKAEIDELKALTDKMTDLEKEISRVKASIDNNSCCSYESILKYLSLREEYGATAKKYSETITPARERLLKRKAVVFAPIMIRIYQKLEQFKKEKGYAMIIDKSAFKDTTMFVFADDDAPDVTIEFIEYYNSVSEKPV